MGASRSVSKGASQFTDRAGSWSGLVLKKPADHRPERVHVDEK